MGNPFGFLEYARKDAPADAITERITNFNEFHTPLSEQEQKKQGERCMHCGVPFCQSGMAINGMISGCPPEFTSRVCPALCEKACTCGANGDAVTVRANEYSIIENAYLEGYARPNPPKVRTGKRVAVRRGHRLGSRGISGGGSAQPQRSQCDGL